jgi:hypothetical protein
MTHFPCRFLMLTVSGAAIFVVHCLLRLVSGDGIVRWSDVGRPDTEFKYLGGVNGLSPNSCHDGLEWPACTSHRAFIYSRRVAKPRYGSMFTCSTPPASARRYKQSA